ncbi:PAP2 superfamily protein [Luteitalea pratensis]|uniref:PAP2 superfamily protein n=1 Tax=Luteitalea pratensis TaxID=1855912 RepID=A0A143PNZ9_LUTPR|nr:vanadium-dependent haloperoxidase [Luteitalea pratensis]AMY09524.1 PAP2 superfamily protein [Luteitalea pratensis]
MLKRSRWTTLGLFCALSIPAPAAAATDPVTEWNLIAVSETLSASPTQAPAVQTRTMAIVQVSVHDAVNAITQQYLSYSSPGHGPSGAGAEAAAIGAAHHALVSLFPAREGALNDLLASSLATHGVSEFDPGLAFGQSVAATILARRATDNAAAAQFDYTAPGAGAAGVWTALGNTPALLPGWGNVTPWVLRSGSQFRPDGPPALSSETYARDYDEVKLIGSFDSSQRTQEQTDIAHFWRASPTAIWNGAMTQVLEGGNLDLSSKARAFALLYLAAADASIACWDAKYTYNFWRPLPAIANGEADGNAATAGDLLWQPLLLTHPHPEYPSGHTTNSGAMNTVIRLLFGNAPGVPIQLTFTGITREWLTLSEGLQEVVDARVYSGIHFRTSDEVGARQGRQVARFVLAHALRPTTGEWK